jgi:hypothetical protein
MPRKGTPEHAQVKVIQSGIMPDQATFKEAVKAILSGTKKVAAASSSNAAASSSNAAPAPDANADRQAKALSQLRQVESATKARNAERAAAAAAAPKKFKTAAEINREKKKDVKEAVVEAAKDAAKVWNRIMNPPPKFLSEYDKRDIGRAEEKIRSASLSKGGGTLISLTNKEFEALVNKHYIEARKKSTSSSNAAGPSADAFTLPKLSSKAIAVRPQDYGKYVRTYVSEEDAPALIAALQDNYPDGAKLWKPAKALRAKGIDD